VFGRYTRTDFTNADTTTVTPLGDVFFIQKSTNWQVSHSLPIGPSLVNQFRLGYVEATTNQNGVTANQPDIDALRMTGVFTKTFRDAQL
jgi:hypothetical protein